MNAPTPARRKPSDDIRASLRDELPRLRREYAVKSLELFGSFVRGEASENSDLDLLVEFDETPTLFSFVRLESELSQLVGVKVDLVMKRALKPVLGERILAEAVPV